MSAEAVSGQQSAASHDAIEAEVLAHCEQAFKSIRLGRRPRRTWQNPKLRVEELKVESPAHLRGCPPEKEDQ